ncbi:MAG: hypothetical protein AAB658_17330, partial [Chloroflexota bacterium]
PQDIDRVLLDIHVDAENGEATKSDESTARLSSTGQAVFFFEPWESTDFRNGRIAIRSFRKSVLFCAAATCSPKSSRTGARR